MNKIKLSLLVVVIAIFINGMVGCNTIQNVENQPSALNTVAPEPTTKEIKITNSPNNTITPSPDENSKTEYSDDLCKDNEEVLFSFKIENSSKTLSICLSKIQLDYIVYRFGTKDKIELEFPENLTDSWNKFNYSYYLRGGGAGNEGMDMNYLTFENGGFEYQIYQEYTAIDKLTQVGVKITDKSTKKETDIKGLSNTIKGGLIELRDNTKIKIEAQ